MVYEYECAECKGYFEVEMRLAEYEAILAEKSPVPHCKFCNKPMKKIITKPVNFKLLGSGWFDQDYQITDMEINQNKENDKRLEDRCMTQAMKDDSNIGEV